MTINRICVKSACVLALFLAAALPLHAEYPDQYVGTGILYIDTDSDTNARGVDVDNGGGLQLIFGQTLGPEWGWESTFFLNDLSVSSGHRNNFYQAGIGIDFLWYFAGQEGFTPFALAGLGAVRNDAPSPVEDDTNPYINLGLGFMSRPLSRKGVRLRGDIRYVKDDFEDQPDDLRLGLAMVFPYGQKTKEVVRTEVREVEVVREVVREQAQADSDGDGVVDGVDRCPNTLRGAKVDQYGCAIRQVVTLEGVNFEYDSARLTSDSLATLSNVADTLQGQPSMEVEIAGHCSSEGSDAYNQRLSERRADSVRDYLASKGVSSRRMRAVGYGESQPVASNDTESGRMQNRRVEFRILRQ